jgi:hypothetical protein
VPQALISINGTTGSNANLPIGTLVTLNNTNTGGEITYLWSILDQPPGTADALSSTTIQNPTFTPNKEGTYLLRLVVNFGLASQVQNQVVAGILQVKTQLRVPAAQETVESGARGWAAAVGLALQTLDALKADPGLCVASSTYTASVGDVVQFSGDVVIKSGLPGQETVPSFAIANATDANAMIWDLGVVVAAVQGGSITSGVLVYVRRSGLVQGVAGVPSGVGEAVYVSDTGNFSLGTPGTNSRQIARVVAFGGGVYDLWVAGGPSPSPAVTSPQNNAIVWSAQQTFNGGVYGATGLVLGTATGQSLFFDINGSSVVQIDPNGMLSVGTPPTTSTAGLITSSVGFGGLGAANALIPLIAVGSATRIDLGSGNTCSVTLPTFLFASLPASPHAGSMVYCSNARVGAEGAGFGTGAILVYKTNGPAGAGWYIVGLYTALVTA